MARVHDIYANRILHVLTSMQECSLQILPTGKKWTYGSFITALECVSISENETWSVDEFLEKNEEACRNAAIELNRKSQMVEEAVEEVLDLVQKATQTFKRMVGIENDIFNDEEDGEANNEGNNATDEKGSSAQQQDWSILWSCFENPLQLLSTQSGGLSKGMQDMVFNAVAEMRRYYSRKVIDVLIRVTRSSLDTLRKSFTVEPDDEKNPQKPIFLLNAMLMIPNVAIRPSLDELQEALIMAGKNITGIAKGVAQWNSSKEATANVATTSRQSRNQLVDERSRRRKLYRLVSEEKPQMPHMTKSFYSYVMDNKEVVKTLSLLSTCTREVKVGLQEFVKKWKPYHFLWKNDKTTRQLLEYGLHDFEATLRTLGELDANLVIEPDMQNFGKSIALSTDRLKFGLAIEIKCN